MQTAQAQKCNGLVATQIKAERMQLELMQQVKDYLGAESMAREISELEPDARKQCGKVAGDAIANAVRILRGGSVEPKDDDVELEPEPQLTTPAKPTRKPPPFSVPADLQGQLEAMTRILGKGWKQLDVKESNAKRMDWLEPLEADRCYAFVGVAGPTAKRLAMYLFEPGGRRRAGLKSRETTAVMYACAALGGDYRLQAKVKRPGEAGYVIATYVRE